VACLSPPLKVELAQFEVKARRDRYRTKQPLV